MADLVSLLLNSCMTALNTAFFGEARYMNYTTPERMDRIKAEFAALLVRTPDYDLTEEERRSAAKLAADVEQLTERIDKRRRAEKTGTQGSV